MQMRLGNAYLTGLNKLLGVVIDEADRMLESGHFEDLENILRALPQVYVDEALSYELYVYEALSYMCMRP